MKKNLIMSMLGTVFWGISLISTNVFAINPYGIVYEDGEVLGENGNVQEEPTLVEGLTVLIEGGSQTEGFIEGKWLDGYIKQGSSTCRKVKYVRVWKNDLINQDSGLTYKWVGSKYYADIRINGVYLEDIEETVESEPAIAVAATDNGALSAGYQVFSDATCETAVENVKSSPGKIFVELEILMRKTESGELFTSDMLYYGITDIDASQSHMILNESEKLTPSNMYAFDLSKLQPEDSTLRNMYVPGTGYIYSEPNFNITVGGNSIFVKVSQATQAEGLRTVYGFGQGNATAGMSYYAKQYEVSYASDENGVISGIVSEKVVSGDKPVGSTTEPEEGFEFDYWVANVDVNLANGETIKKGEKLTLEQLRQVLVNQDIVFTAVHRSSIAVPDTGAFSGELGVVKAVGLVFCGLLGVVAIVVKMVLPRVLKRKIGFKNN